MRVLHMKRYLPGENTQHASLEKKQQYRSGVVKKNVKIYKDQ